MRSLGSLALEILDRAGSAHPVLALVRFPVFLLYLVLAIVCSMLAGRGYGLAQL